MTQHSDYRIFYSPHLTHHWKSFQEVRRTGMRCACERMQPSPSTYTTITVKDDHRGACAAMFIAQGVPELPCEGITGSHDATITRNRNTNMSGNQSFIKNINNGTTQKSITLIWEQHHSSFCAVTHQACSYRLRSVISGTAISEEEVDSIQRLQASRSNQYIDEAKMYHRSRHSGYCRIR